MSIDDDIIETEHWTCVTDIMSGRVSLYDQIEFLFYVCQNKDGNKFVSPVTVTIPINMDEIKSQIEDKLRNKL